MSNRRISLPYGKETIEVSVPENQLIGVYSPQDIPPGAGQSDRVAVLAGTGARQKERGIRRR